MGRSRPHRGTWAARCLAAGMGMLLVANLGHSAPEPSSPPVSPGALPAAGSAVGTPGGEGPAEAPAPEPGHFVEWGEAAIRESSLARARDEAIADAIRNAAHAAALRILGPDALALQATDLEKGALAQPAQWVQNYRVIEQGQVAEVYRVQLDVAILMRSLAQALGRSEPGAQPAPIVLVDSGSPGSPGEPRTVYVELAGDLSWARYREIVAGLRAALGPAGTVSLHGFRPGGMTIAVIGPAGGGAIAEALRAARFGDFTVAAAATGESFVSAAIQAALGAAIPPGAVAPAPGPAEGLTQGAPAP